MGRTFEQVEIPTVGALHDWLAAHHARADGAWFIRWKAHCADRHVPIGAVIEELLCWGWVDAQVRRLDDDRVMTRAGPRNPASAWSGANKRTVARLEAVGRMQPAGRAVIAAAQANGAWSFLDDVERLEQPEDLIAALSGVAGAAKGFAALSEAKQRGVLDWIKRAKTPPTRAKRIAQSVAAAATGTSPLS